MPVAAAATHAELSQLIARGDRKRAASLLVRDHAPAVFSLCRAMVRDPRLAEDLSQDAFARAFHALDGFRGEASPRTWLLRIARNRCLDHLAHARRAPWAGHDDPEPDDHAADEPPPYDLLSRREDAERALAALSESERALVVLHFGHGVGYPELADAFSLRAGTIRMRISRALARMRAALAPELAGDLEHTPPYPSEARAMAPTRASSFTEVDAEAAWELESETGVPSFSEDTARSFSADTARAEYPPEHQAEHQADDDLDALASPAWDDATDRSHATAGFEAEFDDEHTASEPPTFDALLDDLSPGLVHRLDALAASA